MKIRFRMRLTLLKSNIPGTVDNSWFLNEKDNVAQHKMLTQDSEVYEGQQTENVKHIAFIHFLGNFLLQKKQQLW